MTARSTPTSEVTVWPPTSWTRARPRVSTSGTGGTGFGTASERERAAGGLGRRGDADDDLLALLEVGLEQGRQRPVALARLEVTTRKCADGPARENEAGPFVRLPVRQSS